MTLSWDVVSGSVACQIRAYQLTHSSSNPSINIFSSEISSFDAPNAVLGGGTSRRLRCACEVSPIDATPLSEADTFNVPVLKEITFGKVSSLYRMSHTLRHNNLEVRVELPQEYYRHSRFDWTGQIVSVRFKGLEFCGKELEHQTSKQDELYGRGLCNEFGMDNPLGIEGCQAGDLFQKIGVGSLKREEEGYDFQKLYPIEPANFRIEEQDDSVLTIVAESRQGSFGYRLHKSISMLESGFTITSRLTNSGQEFFETEEYNHNFLALDPENLKYCRLLFDFDLQQNAFSEHVNPEQAVRLGKRTLTFQQTPSKAYFFANMSGSEISNPEWRLENDRTGFSISEHADFNVCKVNLWGGRHVISPELFVRIGLAPGESKTWTRTYRIGER